MHLPWNLCYFPMGNNNSWNCIFWLLYSLCCLHHPVLLLLCILSLFPLSSPFSFPFSAAKDMLMSEESLGFPTLWGSGYPLREPHLNFQTCSITWASLLWTYPIFLLLSNTLNLGYEGTQTSFCTLLQPLSFLPTPNPNAYLGWWKLTLCHMLCFLLPVTSMKILHSDFQTFLLGTWRKFPELKNSLHSQQILCFRMCNISKIVSTEPWFLSSSQHLPSPETYWFNN